MKLYPYLQLMRPPNLVTAVSDIWAGMALAGYLNEITWTSTDLTPFILLSIASVCLYAGGVVFNDVFDAALDSIERPERPIPSGRISIKTARILGSILLVISILLSFFIHVASGTIAIIVSVLALVYDKWGKHQSLVGPINMGLCRGGNLLLGISIIPAAISSVWWLSIVPVIYIAAVTIISRGEVHGSPRSYLFFALFLYVIVIAAITSAAFFRKNIIETLPFLVVFGIMVLPALFKAIRTLKPSMIGKAVKAGVLGLILLNASWVAASASIAWAVITALLLPFSMLLAKPFAVT